VRGIMYLLDTNILSELIKKRPNPNFIARLRTEELKTLCTSSICVFELRLGSALRDDFHIFWQRIMNEFLSGISILQFGEDEALLAGDILAQLQKAGQKIGIEDIFIAATAMANRCTLVTANTKHYSRITNLKIENWIN
jgi:tRNA(fMet)-specific endonuclease VapC